MLNAAARAARLVTGTRKFDRGLERLLHDDLHWLDVPERVQFKLGLTVRRCLRRRAPLYIPGTTLLGQLGHVLYETHSGTTGTRGTRLIWDTFWDVLGQLGHVGHVLGRRSRTTATRFI